MKFNYFLVAIIMNTVTYLNYVHSFDSQSTKGHKIFGNAVEVQVHMNTDHPEEDLVKEQEQQQKSQKNKDEQEKETQLKRKEEQKEQEKKEEEEQRRKEEQEQQLKQKEGTSKTEDMESLNKDILNIHLNDTNNECPLCQTTFGDAMEVQKHWYLEHAHDSKEEQKVNSEEYSCPMCNSFKSDKYEKLMGHVNKCLCGKTMDKKNNNGANKKQTEKIGDDELQEMERNSSNISNSSINKPLLEYLIDVDGFCVNGDFMAKELGVLHIPTRRGFNFYFRVGNYNDLTCVNKKSAKFLYNNIHGLKFEDDPSDLPQEEIFTVLQDLIKDIECRNTGGVISYKGGQIELELLENLNYFKAVNIEQYGCPTFNILKAKYNDNILNLFNIPHCTRHQKNTNTKLFHCPLLEIAYFTYWLHDNNIVTIFEDMNENEMKFYQQSDNN